MRILFLCLLISFLSGSATAQSRPASFSDSIARLPLVKIRATIRGFEFGETLKISKDSLRQGFSLVVEGNQLQVIAFVLAYECDDCDVVLQQIRGNAVTPGNFWRLRSLKKGESLTIDSIKAERGGKAYRLPGFVVQIID